MTDYPLKEIIEMANLQIGVGATVHQKWTCSNCGARVTMNEPNTFYAKGYHEDCGATTEIVKCGFGSVYTRHGVTYGL